VTETLVPAVPFALPQPHENAVDLLRELLDRVAT
jgi:hypothetical protein